MSEWQHLVSSNGTDIPVFLTEPMDEHNSTLMILPALGVRGSFYRKLADGLAEQGIATIVLEQRGNGESLYRPGDGSGFDLNAYLEDDVACVTQWAKSRFSDAPLYIGGHSLGGHVASLAVASRQKTYSGVVHLACGFPYHGDFPNPASMFVKFLIIFLPALTKVLGYFPGQWFGFGGREYRGLMLDWRLWARSGNYNIAGFEGVERSLSSYPGRVISVAFEEDTMATTKAIDRSCAVYKRARLTRVKLGAEEQGEYLGHVNWGKKPSGVVKTLAGWLKVG